MRKVLITGLSLLVSIWGFSFDATKYDKIYNSLKNHSLQSLNESGEVFYKRNSLDSALVCFSIISASYNPDSHEEDGQMYAHAYNRCGAIYLRYNSYTKALNMFLKGLEICEQTGNEKYISRIYNNIGNVYYVFHNYRMAQNYCEKAYNIGLKYEDKEIQKLVLNNMIGINCYLEEYVKAKKNLNALKSLEPDNEPSFDYYYCICKGALELKGHKFEDAIKWFKESISYAENCPSPNRLKYASYSNLAKVFDYVDRFDSALVYLGKGEKLVNSNSDIDLRFECYNDFSKLYGKMGNEKISLFYKKKHMEVAESIFSVREFGQIKDMQFLREMDEIEKQIYRLTDAQKLKDNQIKFQQRVLLIIVSAFVIIAVLLIIMFIQNRKLKEANAELFNKNLEVMRSEEIEKKNRQHSVDRTKVDETTPDLFHEEANDSETNRVKYQNSVINDEEKKRIGEAILDIMDTTLEYCSVDFNLDKMAMLIQSKSKYVSQVINESYGKNFNVFVNEYRIKEARRRLIDIANYGNLTIAAIAMGVGFKSNANFNLVFKKVTGITPSVYQMMARKRVRQVDESEPGDSE